ncbi:hypothetical protein A2V61_04525 [Candidatus Woesebacteria bacterium RBG_19FT_COMBO_47_8]|uniref:Urease accessory protein UreH-like transmembrane domain-containing protein n=1 Tax=Candidatus Woesebacteria bacterium RBG_13_46_13 TaxID=1802479 RepID=A0A1F7X4U4_9BACT|nr:MAG: hypothetical protein A2Y68_01390 [Candidatus Woesebacteria bacterium RBG_13_46_13]OGM17494.1 MAG: hypothetical protein A2V61_04525 [Candidatus Woesebacteria bacterium RBG_19FT_COMBO_47_8]HJX59237.1 sulfite exporter TauE/SafE family protein [Patescibacteria group bacterium]
MQQIWLAFLTGLTSGAISCFAIQGGLLASSLAQDKEPQKDSKSLKILIFLGFKILFYSLLGLGLGLAGSKLAISTNIQAALQILVGLFLLATAARIVNLHPLFRYFVIQPPTFLYKIIKKQTKLGSYFAPATLGAMTILIPCGVTQAMMLLAIASGSALYGAAIMFAFSLGTSPVFFALGLAAAEMLKRKAFVVASAILILLLGVLSFNAGLAILGSKYTIQNLYKSLFSVNGSAKQARIIQGKQEATINVTATGYRADVDTLKAGVPVSLKLVSQNSYSCARAFAIPEMGISILLAPTGTRVLEFTPTKTGSLVYTCSMGMYTGSFNIVP